MCLVEALALKHGNAMQSGSAKDVFVFVIRSVRLGNEIRLKRHLKDLKLEDSQASGGLDVHAFISFCGVKFPSYAAASARAWFMLNGEADQNAIVLPYAALQPICACIELLCAIDSWAAKGTQVLADKHLQML
jgi:hypothetical protein